MATIEGKILKTNDVYRYICTNSKRVIRGISNWYASREYNTERNCVVYNLNVYIAERDSHTPMLYLYTCKDEESLNEAIKSVNKTLKEFGWR